MRPEVLERLSAAKAGAKADAGQPAADLGIWDAGDDDGEISPREWLLSNVFCKEFVSSLIAEGGTGKTALRLAQALAMATGRNLTDEHVFVRCRVLVVSLEDGVKELRRRVRAARRHYGITNADVKGWLFLSAPGNRAGKLMTADERGRTQEGRMAELLRKAIVEHKIDIVILDPFIKTHSVEENSNSAMDAVIQLLTEMTTEYNIALDTPHHMSKGTSDPGNASRGRGASAQKDGGRLVYTLTQMSEEEAQAFNIPDGERRLYVRTDSAKVNITPPMEKAKWYRLVGVSLDNATDTYPAGDNIQVAEPWYPPALMEDLDRILLNQILDDIEAGMPDGNRYTAAPNAVERAAWPVVRKHASAKSEQQCRNIIRLWVKNKALVPRKYPNPVTRKEVDGLYVIDANRP